MKLLKMMIHNSLDNTYTHHIGIYPKNSHFVSTQMNKVIINIILLYVCTSSNIVAAFMTVDHSSCGSCMAASGADSMASIILDNNELFCDDEPMA